MKTTTIKIRTHDALGKPFVLCYVSNNFAYFTSQKLEDQDGDDWHKKNSTSGSPPFTYRKEYDGDRLGKDPWEVIKIGYEGPFENSDYLCDRLSVEQINRGGAAWLMYCGKDKRKSIYAGATVLEFIEQVKATGGQVYVDLDEIKEDEALDKSPFSALSPSKKEELFWQIAQKKGKPGLVAWLWLLSYDEYIRNKIESAFGEDLTTWTDGLAYIDKEVKK